MEQLHSSYLEEGKCGPEQLSVHNQCIATQPLSDVTHMALNRVVGTTCGGTLHHGGTRPVEQFQWPEAFFIPDLPIVGKWTRRH